MLTPCTRSKNLLTFFRVTTLKLKSEEKIGIQKDMTKKGKKEYFVHFSHN